MGPVGRVRGNDFLSSEETLKMFREQKQRAIKLFNLTKAECLGGCGSKVYRYIDDHGRVWFYDNSVDYLSNGENHTAIWDRGY
jgi:hypothetical protein